MTKLLVISRSRPGIDIGDLFSLYEFSVVPRTLFEQSGIPLRCLDKSSFLVELEKLTPFEWIRPEGEKCQIIDCVGVVNQLKITPSVKNDDRSSNIIL